MSTPFLGEIRMFGGNFAPQGWAFCNGQLLSISQNAELFGLIGTTYGGNGQTTFGLPDLQGRIPVHQGTIQGTSFTLGEKAGTEVVTLTAQQIPIHNHVPQCQSGSGGQAPTNGVWASSAQTIYDNTAPGATMNPAAVSNVGGSQPHDNMTPYLVISFIISLLGVIPSQT